MGIHGDVDVFINYRTADAGYGAAACYELLATAFGGKRVFRDCVSMRPGELYPQAIGQALEQARILLILIGPHWLAEDPAGGGRLVDREDDWVRREIRRAFERGIPVVQVLLDGARPVEADELPLDIARLALCQAAYVAHRSLGATYGGWPTRSPSWFRSFGCPICSSLGVSCLPTLCPACCCRPTTA